MVGRTEGARSTYTEPMVMAWASCGRRRWLPLAMGGNSLRASLLQARTLSHGRKQTRGKRMHLHDSLEVVHVAMVRSVARFRVWRVKTIILILKRLIARRQTVASERKAGSSEKS